MPAAELLPCPFCGCEPVVRVDDGPTQIYCGNEHCIAQVCCLGFDETEARRLWDRRYGYTHAIERALVRGQVDGAADERAAIVEFLRRHPGMGAALARFVEDGVHRR